MKNKKITKTLLLALLLTVFFSATATKVQAAVTLVKSDQTAVVEFCKNNIKQSIAKSVCTTTSSNKALTAASTSSTCASFKDKSKTGGARFRQCMVSSAKGYFSDAYSPVPKDADAFNSAFNSVIGSVPKPAAPGGSSTGGGSSSTPAAPSADCTDIGGGCNLAAKYLNPLINLLAALVGIVAVISLIVGGIQYSTAGSDPQKIILAKNRIGITIASLLGFFVLYSFLQFLIPGGIFK